VVDVVWVLVVVIVLVIAIDAVWELVETLRMLYCG